MEGLVILRRIIFGIFYYPLLFLTKAFTFIAQSTRIIPWFMIFLLILMVIVSALETKFANLGGDIVGAIVCSMIFYWLFSLAANFLGMIFSFIASGFAILAGLFAYLGGYEME